MSARWSDEVSQQVFDVFMRTLAEPGSIGRLPAAATASTPLLTLPLALADVDVAVSVPESEAGWATEVRDATGAPIVGIEQAWIVVLDRAEAALIERVPVGSAFEPERAGRVALPVSDLGVDPADDEVDVELVLHLSGPGVSGERALAVGGLGPEVVDRLGAGRGLFPGGIDAWLFTPDGRVAALPRSTRIRAERTGNRSSEQPLERAAGRQPMTAERADDQKGWAWDT